MAKNNSSKISIAALDKLLKQVDTGASTVTLHVGDESIDIEVQKSISLQEYCNMVQEAADSCFQMDELGQEHYVAGVGDFACDYAMLKYMTNLKTAIDVQNAQQHNDRLFALCSNSDLVKKVEEILPVRFVVDYHNAVYEQVEFLKQRLLSSERKALLAAIDQIEKANTTFTQFVEMFQDIDPSMMVDMMQKIASIDESKLGEAVIDSMDEELIKQQRQKIVEMPNVKH